MERQNWGRVWAWFGIYELWNLDITYRNKMDLRSQNTKRRPFSLHHAQDGVLFHPGMQLWRVVVECKRDSCRKNPAVEAIEVEWPLLILHFHIRWWQLSSSRLSTYTGAAALQHSQGHWNAVCRTYASQSSIHLLRGPIAAFSISKSLMSDMEKLGRKRTLSKHTRWSAATQTTRCRVLRFLKSENLKKKSVFYTSAIQDPSILPFFNAFFFCHQKFRISRLKLPEKESAVTAVWYVIPVP